MYKPPYNTHRTFTLEGLTGDEVYYKCYYEVSDHDVLDKDLPNKLTTDMLNAEIFMTNLVAKKNKQYTRIQERSLRTAQMWAERFRGDVINEEDDEVPFTKAQIRSLPSRGLISTGGNRTDLVHTTSTL